MDEHDRLKVALRAHGDFARLILYLTKVEEGFTDDVPQFKTREGRFLYDRFIAPRLGLPAASERPLDRSRLDMDVVEELSPTGDAVSLSSRVVECFLDGSLDPCSEQYRLCLQVVRPYAAAFADLLPNHSFK